jgi:hypothetical protein
MEPACSCAPRSPTRPPASRRAPRCGRWHSEDRELRDPACAFALGPSPAASHLLLVALSRLPHRAARSVKSSPTRSGPNVAWRPLTSRGSPCPSAAATRAWRSAAARHRLWRAPSRSSRWRTRAGLGRSPRARARTATRAVALLVGRAWSPSASRDARRAGAPAATGQRRTPRRRTRARLALGPANARARRRAAAVLGRSMPRTPRASRKPAVRARPRRDPACRAGSAPAP